MMKAEVISIKLVNTDKGVSNEGQNLTECKLVIELKIHEKVKYVADEATQSVHVAEFVNYNSVFVIVPCSIGGVDICEYLRKNKVIVTPYIEDIYAEMIGDRTIFKNITMLVDVVIRNY